MFFNVLFLISLLLVTVWPISIMLGIYSNLRFVDAFSHLALPFVLIFLLITGLKSLSLFLFFLIFVFFLNRYFEVFDFKNLDVDLLSLSSFGLVSGLFILKLLPKNWHIDSDVLLFGNLDVFYLNNLSLFGFEISLIIVILILLSFVNYLFLFLNLPSLLKNILYKSNFKLSKFWFVLILSLNLLLLFYLMGAFLLLGLFSLPLLISFVFSRSFKSYLFSALFIPLIFTPFLFFYFLQFDFSISLTLVIALFALFVLCFLLTNIIKIFNE